MPEATVAGDNRDVSIIQVHDGPLQMKSSLCNNFFHVFQNVNFSHWSHLGPGCFPLITL